MAGNLWKPVSESDGNLVILFEKDVNNVVIRDAETGQILDRGRSTGPSNGRAETVRFSRPGNAYQNVIVEVEGGESFYIDNGSQRRENFTFSAAGETPTEVTGQVTGGSGGGGSGPFPAGTSPGGYGAVPFYLGGAFPNPTFTSFPNIKGAQAEFVDPMKFAEKFGEFNRGEFIKNSELAQGIAQGVASDLLDQELKQLQTYVPQMSNLKRSELAKDNDFQRAQIAINNVFNQQQRTDQINQVLPDARGQLRDQGRRAEVYASGNAPNEVIDSALDLNARSAAADQARVGGFGARSSVSRKAGELMSAEQRLSLAQYGENLLTGNINQSANLLLSPTAYAQAQISDAGAQVKVNPTVSPAQLAGNIYSNQSNAINAGTIITPTQALTTDIQQKQFNTNLKQRTQEFNATGTYNANTYNAGVANQFALGKFNYDVGYAGLQAGALQNDINTQLALDQQQQAQDTFEQNKQDTQDANEAGSLTEAIGAIPEIVDSTIDAIDAITEDDSNTDTGGSSSTPDIIDSDSSSSGGGEVVTAPDAVPEGNVPIASDESGGVVSVPEADYRSAPAQTATTRSISTPTMGAERVSVGNTNAGANFASIAGNTALGNEMSNPNSLTARAAARSASAVISSSGISTEPQKGYQPAGYNRSGQAVYSDPDAAKSNDTEAGARVTSAIESILSPLGVFDDEDADMMDKVKAATSDAAFVARLTQYAQNGDHEKFINSVLQKFKQPILDELSNDPKNKSGASAAFAAYNLFTNWENMSPAQKALGLATLGLQSSKFATGEDFGSKFVVEPNGVNPGLTVGQTLAIAQQGYNVYALADNWEDLSNIQRAVYGTNTTASVVNTAVRYGLIDDAASAGASAASSGISTGVSGGSAVGGGGAGGASAAAAGAPTTASVIGNVAGAAGVAAGAYTIYENWGSGGSRGAATGSLGAASVALGLNAMGYALGPYGWAAVIAVGALSGYFGSGKGEDQLARDGIRSWMKEDGFINDNWEVTLADGSKANVGQDFGNGAHNITNKDMFDNKNDSNSRQLEAWELDYTNDLDYAAHMGTTTLMRLLSGGSEKATEQFGAQLANAALQNVGYGEQMTEENFGKMAENVRSFFSQKGIKSKEEAWQLADLLAEEGRITGTQLVQMQQALNMYYDDNGYQLASTLMAGRNRGIEAVQENVQVDNSHGAPVPKPVTAPTKEEAVARNRKNYGAIAA